jgi:hypothetical protein
MMWWFLILAFSAGALLWVGIASYFRVRRNMKPDTTSQETQNKP